MSDLVLVEKSDGIATLTLNRPEAMNALDQALAEGLRDALAAVEGDPETRVVVLAGAGRAFMAGGDVKSFHESAQRGPDAIRGTVDALIPPTHQAVRILARMPQPVVARVSGAAAGAGLSLMLGTDLVVAGEKTRFTLAYSTIGTSPDGGSTWALPRLVGLKKAAELALLSDFFDAAEALRLGLVNRVVPEASLEDETRALAERLASGPAQAFARTKALLRGAFDHGLDAQLDREHESFRACAGSADFAEGVAAFSEKRKAVFGKG